jgi:hypothetical protein
VKSWAYSSLPQSWLGKGADVAGQTPGECVVLLWVWAKELVRHGFKSQLSHYLAIWPVTNDSVFVSLSLSSKQGNNCLAGLII